jgi:hypothetical protein
MDAVLPPDTILDFVLTDTQGMEVECLEGLKETMQRSPNMVLVVEWMGYSYTPEMTKERRGELLDWFAVRGYRVYEFVISP